MTSLAAFPLLAATAVELRREQDDAAADAAEQQLRRLAADTVHVGEDAVTALLAAAEQGAASVWRCRMILQPPTLALPPP